MRVSYLITVFLVSVAPGAIILLTLYDLGVFCCSVSTYYSPSQLFILAYWSGALFLSARQVSAVTLLFLQQSYFVLVHYENRIRFLRGRLAKAVLLGELKSRRGLIDCSTTRTVKLVEELSTTVIASFLRLQAQTKFLSRLLFTTALLLTELLSYALLDGRSGHFLRLMATAQLPFLLLLLLIYYYLLGQLNATSKRALLPLLDRCLHRSSFSSYQEFPDKKKSNLQRLIKFKLNLAEQWTAIARDVLAVQLGDAGLLTRAAVFASFRRLFADLFLITDLNR